MKEKVIKFLEEWELIIVTTLVLFGLPSKTHGEHIFRCFVVYMSVKLIIKLDELIKLSEYNIVINHNRHIKQLNKENDK